MQTSSINVTATPARLAHDAAISRRITQSKYVPDGGFVEPDEECQEEDPDFETDIDSESDD
jgi:hypothetical protein